MHAFRRLVLTLALVPLALLLLPTVTAALTEPETGIEVPDTVTLESHTLRAAGAGIREKTFLSVNVYLITAYVDEEAQISGDPAAALRGLDAPKSLRMHLLRGFSREKLVKAFVEVIEKNYDDTSAFAEAMATFEAYWDRDAREGDLIHFDFVPGSGLKTTVNGEVKGVIDDPAFVEALWTVWFGEKPADKGLREDLTALLRGSDG